VIASHYAVPVERRLCAAATLRSSPSSDAEALLELNPGEPLLMLDDSLGWAWGYAGEERCVGYTPSEALAPQ
jgi:Bacterial dipeptidyl-peptidase Sh3 domain